MNKFRVLKVIICCSLSIPSYAQEVPIVKDNASVPQLIADNKALLNSIQNQKSALEHEAHMYSRPDQYGKLTNVLNAYQDFIDRKGNLPEDKRRALDQIVDASAEVGHTRERGAPGYGSGNGNDDNGVPLNDASIQDALDQNQRLLDNQAALLKEKNDQLKDFKDQLLHIKGQLAKNNDRYASQMRETPKPVATTIIKEVPVKEIVYMDNPSLAKALAQKSQELDNIKHKLAGFKDQLAHNNRRYQDAVKNAKADARKDSADRFRDDKLRDQNKKLQDDLRALKEENVRNIRQAQEAAKAAAIAKALAQRNLIDDKSNQLNNYKSELKELKDRLAQTNRALEETNKAATRKARDQELDQEEAARLQKAMDEKSAQINDLIGKNRSLENTVRDLQNAIVKKDNERAPEKLQQALWENSGKDQQLERYKLELEKLKEQFDNVNKRADQAMRETPAKAVQTQLDQEQAARLQRAIEQKTDQVNALIGQNKRLSSTIEALQDAVAKKENVPAPKQLAQAMSDRDQLLKNKDELLAEKSTQSSRLKDELSRIKDDLSKTNDRYDQAIKEYKDKTRNASLDAEESARLAKELADKTAKMGDLETKNQELARTVNAIKDNKSQLFELEKLLNQKDEQIALLKSELARALEQNTLMHQQLDQEDVDLHQIRDKAELFRKKYLEQLELVENKEKDIARLNEQMAQMPKSEIYDAKIAALKEQVVKDQEQMRGLRDQLTQLALGSTANKDELDAKNDRLKALELKAADNRLITGSKGDDEALAKQLAAAKEQISDLKAQLKKDDDAFAQIKDKGNALKDRIAVLSSDIASKDAQLAALSVRAKEGSNSSESKVNDAGKPSQPAQQQLQDLRAQAKELRDQLMQLKAEQRQPAADIGVSSDAMARLEAAEKESKGLREQIAKASLTPQEQTQFDNLKKQYEIVVKNPVKNGKDTNADIEELKRHYEIVVKSPQEIAEMIKENRMPEERSQQLDQPQLLALKAQAKELREQQQPVVEKGLSQASALKLEAAEKEANELREQIAQEQAQSKRLREELAKTTDVTKDMASKGDAAIIAQQVAASQEHIADLQAQLKKDDEAFAHIKDKGLELKDKIASLSNDVALKDAQIEQLKLNLKQSVSAQAVKDSDAQKQMQTAEVLRRQIEKMAKAQLTPQEQVQFDNLKKQYEIVVQNPVKDAKEVDPQVETLKRNYEIVVKSPQEIVQIIKDGRTPASTTDNVKVEEVKNKLHIVEQEAQVLRDQVVKLKEIQMARTDKDKVDTISKQLESALAETNGLKTQIAQLRLVQSKSIDRARFDELTKQYEMVLKMPAKVTVKETVKEVIKLVPADTKALEQKLSVAQKEAQDLKGRMAQLQANKDKETAQVSEKFNDLKSQLSVSQEQFTALKTEILKNREIITAKQDQTITLQSSINEQIGKLAQTSAQIKQKDERMALQEMLQAKQRQHIDLLVRKNQLIADYQNSLVDKLNAYKQKFNGASNDWAVHAQEYAAKLAEFRASIDAMNNNNAQLNESIQRSKQEKDDAYQLMDRFKDRLKETADVNESQGKELLQYRQKSDMLEQSLRKFQDDMSGKDSALALTQERLGKLKAEHAQVLEEVQVKDLSLTMVQSSMQAKTKILQTLVDQLKDQIKISDAQLAALRKQLKDAEAQIVATNRHEDLARLKEMLKSSREEILQINNLLKEKEQQVEKLQKDLQDNSIDFTSQHKAIEALKVDMDKQQKSIMKLNEDIDWKNKENARLKAQLKEKKIDLLPASLQGVELVIAKDRKQIALLTTQLQAANAKIHVVATPKVSDPQGLRRALADAQEEIATLREKLHQKLQGLVKNDPFVIAMNKEIQSLRQSLVEVMRENGDLKDKNESLFYDMKEMQDELAKCQEQIKSLPATTK